MPLIPPTWLAILSTVAAIALAGCAVPEEARAPDDAAQEHVILTPTDIEWGPGPNSLPSGARLAVLSGDPAGLGIFTMRADIPSNYEIPPHTHPGTEHVTVISGTAFLGLGDELDGANATELPAGSFFALRPGTEHFFFAGNEPVVIQLHGEAPWGIEYLDPADDPRGADGR